MPYFETCPPNRELGAGWTIGMSRVSGLGTTARARHAVRRTNMDHVGQPRRGATTNQLPDAIGIRSSVADCGPPVA
jgi:hypothetical protein